MRGRHASSDERRGSLEERVRRLLRAIHRVEDEGGGRASFAYASKFGSPDPVLKMFGEDAVLAAHEHGFVEAVGADDEELPFSAFLEGDASGEAVAALTESGRRWLRSNQGLP